MADNSGTTHRVSESNQRIDAGDVTLFECPACEQKMFRKYHKCIFCKARLIWKEHPCSKSPHSHV